MNRPGPSAATRPDLTDDAIARYLRARGAAAPPLDDILADAQREALRPHRDVRWGAVAAVVAAVAVTLGLVVGILVLAPGATDMSVTGAPTRPAREVVLATYHETTTGSEVLLRPADPATARPLDGFDPIVIAQPFEPHLSPDGRTLAVMTWITDEIGTGTLTLIDLADWQAVRTPVNDLYDFRAPTWTPDSRGLVWLAPAERSTTVPVGRAYEVVRWDIGWPSARTVVALPDPAFRPWDAHLMTSSMLVVVGQAVDGRDIATDVPHVVVIDLAAGRVTADLAIDGLETGRQQVRGDPEVTLESRPAIVWDTPRQRLFLAAIDQLVQVVPGSATVSGGYLSVDTRPQRVPNEMLTGAISPDGRSLYLTGVQTVVDDGIQQPSDAVGLRVIDTQDVRTVANLDHDIAQLVLSPDGQRLLVGTSTRPPDATQAPIPSAGSLLIDTASLAVIMEDDQPPGAAYVHLAVSWDGRFGYLTTSIMDGSGTTQQVEVIDLVDGSVVSRHTVDPGEPLVQLLVPGP